MTVVCLEAPSGGLQALVPSAQFHEVELVPLLSRIMPHYRRLSTLPARLIEKLEAKTNGQKPTPPKLSRVAANNSDSSQNGFLFKNTKIQSIVAKEKLRWIRIKQSLSHFKQRTLTQMRRRAVSSITSAVWEKNGPWGTAIRHPFRMLLLRPFALLLLAPLNPAGLFHIKWEMTDAELLRLFLAPYFNLANSYNFSDKACELLLNETFDLYQAHDSHALLAASRLSKRDDVPYVYDILEISVDRSGPAAMKRPLTLKVIEDAIERRLVRRAAKTLCVGPAVADHSAKHFNISTPTVVRNCCLYQEVEENNAIKEYLGLNGKERVCLVIGAIYNNQGLEQLIEALPACHSTIHIAAMGPVAQQGIIEELENQATSLGVNDRFHIIPPRPPEDLIRYASSADAGVIARQATCLNNLYSLPNKIFEMVMARLPVLSGNLPNIKMIVDSFNIGDTFDQSDPKSISHAINAFFKDEFLFEMRKANAVEAAKTLCWEKESDTYLEAINSVLN
ncbi:MAG: glycosyltransferase [Oscillospiraceae bacterium]|nr:glycosyltransferase [Oscillospiraceae bacterium]